MLEFIFSALWLSLVFVPIFLLIRAKSQILSACGIFFLFTFPLVMATPFGTLGQLFGVFLIPINIIYITTLCPLIGMPSLLAGVAIGVIVWLKISKHGRYKVNVSIAMFAGVMSIWLFAELLQVNYMRHSAKKQFGEQYCVAFASRAVGAVIGATPGAYFDPPAVWHAKLISPKGFYHWSYRELAWIGHQDDFLERNGVITSAREYEKCRIEQKK